MDNSGLFILIFTLILAIFVFIISAILIYIYKNSTENNLDEERENLLSEQPTSKFRTQESSFIDIKLVDKVKIEHEKNISETKESAFLYLKFFMRSNPRNKFKSVEQLPLIGKTSWRNWFLLENASGKKISFVDSLRPEIKRQDLLSIAKTMEVSFSELHHLINDILISVKQPNLLPFYCMCIEDSKVLVIQDYSKEGNIKI